MNIGRRDAWAMSLLVTSALGSAAIAFAVQAALARSLSPSEFGRFAAALAVVTIIAPAVGFGLPAFWLKAFGTEGWYATRWMEVSVRFIRRSSLACLLIAGVWAGVGSVDAITGRLILLMLPVVLTQGAIEMASAKLQLEEKFGRVALWQALQHVARLVLVLVCWSMHVGIEYFALGFGCIGVLVAIGAWKSISMLRHGAAALVGHGPRPADAIDRTDLSTPSLAELWRNTMPFGVASLLFYTYGQSGLVIVSHLATPHDAGLYSVAITILTSLYLVPTVLFQKLLMPRLHRWAATGDRRLEQVYRVGNRWMVVSGVAFAVVAALLAPIALPLVFSEKYSDAVGVVVLMTLCVPFRFLTVSASSVMTTRDLIGIRNRCAAGALVFSVISACVAVPLWGLTGAAIAAIAGEIVWASLSVTCARHYLLKIRQNFVPNENASRILDSETASRPTDALVSVIIPCFNCSSTIGRAVESVFKQRCRPREVILVDDCSTDDTRDQLAKLARIYPDNWIRVIHQPHNAGPGAARNAAWAVATQPYVAFLDSDDSWHPAKILIQYEWMRKHPDAAITGHPVAQLESQQNPQSLPVPAAGAPHRVSRARILFSNRFTPSSILMRTDAKARFDETKRHAEDYFMLLELVLAERGHAYLFTVPLSYIFKAQFGAQTGLSAQLWKIQKGEQDNYRHFRRQGLISNLEWACFSLSSVVKYLRRCILSRRFT